MAFTPYSVDKLRELELDRSFDVRRIYQVILATRVLDEMFLGLQRQGRLDFYATTTGEEAAVVASAAALKAEDVVFQSYREIGAALYRGYSLDSYLCQLQGNKNDPAKGHQMPLHFTARDINFVTASSPVGTQIPQAVGWALAAKLSKDPVVAMAYFGEGATSTADFHVGLNFAGVYRVPAVFFCRNNQWAISVPVTTQTASESIAAKATAYGIRGVKVDGTNVLEVYETVRDLVERARTEHQPALIEALMFRLGAHSSSDDPSRYQMAEERKVWEENDPLLRLRGFLLENHLLTEREEEGWRETIEGDLKEAIARTEAIDRPDLPSLVEDVFDQIPWYLEEQLEKSVL